MRFRPCIDLRRGKVVQIVGKTLREDAEPETNFETDASPAEFAARFRRDGLSDGHVIMLGPGSEDAARSALDAYPDGFQIGGGITPDNAGQWLEAGASAVIATSSLFRQGVFDWKQLQRFRSEVGAERLVLDLSCARDGDDYRVMADRWQTRTDVIVDAASLGELSAHCAEFLIHAVDVEGRQAGPDRELLERLADAPLPTTYAGGIHSLADVELVRSAGRGRLDFTVGSALDLFGGDRLRYSDLVRFAGG